jgi:hypothetical protein
VQHDTVRSQTGDEIWTGKVVGALYYVGVHPSMLTEVSARSMGRAGHIQSMEDVLAIQCEHKGTAHFQNDRGNKCGVLRT